MLEQAQRQNFWYGESKQHTEQGQDSTSATDKFTYFKCEGRHYLKDKPINFPMAKTEIEALGCGAGYYFIGFTNVETHEYVQFLKFEPDLFYADVPIGGWQTTWDGYVWGCDTNLDGVLNLVQLFLNESSWFDALPFVMRRMPEDIVRDANAKGRK